MSGNQRYHLQHFLYFFLWLYVAGSLQIRQGAKHFDFPQSFMRS
jgi:hypothetical protein